jgi:hypothetical protein
MRDLRPCDGCNGPLALTPVFGVFRRVTIEVFGMGSEVHRGMGAVQMMGGSLRLADAMGMLPDLPHVGPPTTVLLCGHCYARSTLPEAEESCFTRAAAIEAKRAAEAKARETRA